MDIDERYRIHDVPPVTCAGCGSVEHRTDGCPGNPFVKRIEEISKRLEEARINDLKVETAAQQAVINGLHDLVDQYVAERDTLFTELAALRARIADTDAIAKRIYEHMFPDRYGWEKETDEWLKGRYVDNALAVQKFLKGE